MKLHSFDPNNSYRFRTLSELNVLSSTINEPKSKLSTSLQYYLQKYRQILDIPRLCRALAIPGELAENFIKAGRLEQQYAARDELDRVQYLPIINQIVQTLQRYLYLKDNVENGNNNNNSKNNLIVSNLSNNQKEAIYTDINELAVYSKMYYDIETVKSDPLIVDEYPHGNPFDHIIDIMSQGAIIIRFKYVSAKSLLPPEEKVVSYHLMDFENKKVLGVHIEGEKKFSMYKQWGEGDERLLPIYPEYTNTIIRWGKEEVEEAIINKNKRDNAQEFLY
ncbi:MAG TPA: hypothetical protein VE573_16315 [Nitrososphaeraceae archaeon]|nr:hypothetical protein [Nitrososphaeraceae archaeon]